MRDRGWEWEAGCGGEVCLGSIGARADRMGLVYEYQNARSCAVILWVGMEMGSCED